jgi:uncharacterized protein
MTAPRVVLDTNVIVSALFWGGTPGMVFLAALSGEILSITSAPLMLEMRRVISRPKFAAKLTEKQWTVEAIGLTYYLISILEPTADIPPNIVRDPKDQIVLATAVGGKADYICSGDKDLLTLKEYDGIPILNSADLLQRFTR